jgi:hypothetical protein
MRIAAKAKTNALKMTFARHNWAMRRLSRKAGGRIDVVFDSLSVEIDLRRVRSVPNLKFGEAPSIKL